MLVAKAREWDPKSAREGSEERHPATRNTACTRLRRGGALKGRPGSGAAAAGLELLAAAAGTGIVPTDLGQLATLG